MPSIKFNKGACPLCSADDFVRIGPRYRSFRVYHEQIQACVAHYHLRNRGRIAHTRMVIVGRPTMTSDTKYAGARRTIGCSRMRSCGVDGAVVRRGQDMGHLLYQYYMNSFRLNTELGTRTTEQQPPINQLRRRATGRDEGEK